MPSHSSSSAQPTSTSANINTNTPSTAIQFVQNGTLWGIDLPGARNPREIERLQEYIQNTAFGTTNLMRSMSRQSIDFIRNHHYSSEKIVGGVFDGLSNQEAQWLQEQEWVDYKQPSDQGHSENEMRFLQEQSAPKSQPTSFIVPPTPATAQPMVSRKFHLLGRKLGQEADLGKPAPAACVMKEITTKALPALSTSAKAESIATAFSGRLGVVGDRRPGGYIAQNGTASYRPRRARTPSICSLSTISANSAEDPPTRSGASSPSLLAQLVQTSTPDDSETAAAPAPTHPARVRIPLIATIRHESLHSSWCPFACKYDPGKKHMDHAASWTRAMVVEFVHSAGGCPGVGARL